MQIASSRRPLSAASKNAVAPAEEQKQQQFRPLNEQWVVNGETYQSTQELVASARTLDNVEVTYRYTTEEASDPFTKGERMRNAFGSGVAGATAGLMVGGFVSVGFAVLGGVADIISGLAGGRMDGVSKVALLAPLVLGGTIGAGIGATDGYSLEAPPVPGGEVTGILSKGEGGTVFYPAGQVEKKVDLEQFQSAPVPESTPAEVPESKPVVNALKGAGAALAAIPAQFIPLGLFAPPAVGSMVGDALDDRTGLGFGLGALGGTAITGASIYGISQAIPQGWNATPNYLPLAALAGGLAIGGALLGDKVLTKMNTVAAHREYGDQWWIENSVKEDS